jgi:TnpA family transposase
VISDQQSPSLEAEACRGAADEVGRVVKTTYILRYAHDAEVRDRVHLQLNRGESRHALARRIFFANQGAFRVGDYEEIMNKVSPVRHLSPT